MVESQCLAIVGWYFDIGIGFSRATACAVYAKVYMHTTRHMCLWVVVAGTGRLESGGGGGGTVRW